MSSGKVLITFHLLAEGSAIQLPDFQASFETRIV